ncbi:hypothetical protein KSB_83840 [Ktedonobacter robiniae]|uniref:Uncharacterized protein n=1 Tax=Ktedonobacter robiniae TaxID=2778365 RepID=A0ABQ3V416_9CHLR|nr:hypothetical protein KSB_83840 [Ktedonobacter robiniae]
MYLHTRCAGKSGKNQCSGNESHLVMDSGLTFHLSTAYTWASITSKKEQYGQPWHDVTTKLFACEEDSKFMSPQLTTRRSAGESLPIRAF